MRYLSSRRTAQQKAFTEPVHTTDSISGYDKYLKNKLIPDDDESIVCLHERKVYLYSLWCN